MLTGRARADNLAWSAQQRLQAAAGKRAEAQLLAQGVELIDLSRLAFEGFDAAGTGRVQRDPGQPPAHPRLLRMLAQSRRATGGAAQAQERHLVDAIEQGIQVVEMAE